MKKPKEYIIDKKIF